ncbi:MAG: hypothetical protein AAFV19_10500 [Pseudomonadota bacterium]
MSDLREERAALPQRFALQPALERSVAQASLAETFPYGAVDAQLAPVLRYVSAAPYPYFETKTLTVMRAASGTGRIFATVEKKIGRDAGQQANYVDVDAALMASLDEMTSTVLTTAAAEMEWIGRDGVWINVTHHSVPGVQLWAWSPGKGSLPGRYSQIMNDAVATILVEKVNAPDWITRADALRDAMLAQGPAEDAR